jgi:uncharacterized protein YndB with AHSA1/START domain
MINNIRVLGSLSVADGVGVIRMEERFDAGIDELWSALTDEEQLVLWYGVIDGELGLGSRFRATLYASGWDGTVRVDACEPPRRFVVVARQAGGGAREISTEVTLTEEGDQTVLVLNRIGLPLDQLWAYGAGTQIHVEDLAAYLAGDGRVDAKARFDELQPVYRDLGGRLAVDG